MCGAADVPPRIALEVGAGVVLVDVGVGAAASDVGGVVDAISGASGVDGALLEASRDEPEAAVALGVAKLERSGVASCVHAPSSNALVAIDHRG